LTAVAREGERATESAPPRRKIMIRKKVIVASIDPKGSKTNGSVKSER